MLNIHLTSVELKQQYVIQSHTYQRGDVLLCHVPLAVKSSILSTLHHKGFQSCS